MSLLCVSTDCRNCMIWFYLTISHEVDIIAIIEDNKS